MAAEAVVGEDREHVFGEVDGGEVEVAAAKTHGRAPPPRAIASSSTAQRRRRRRERNDRGEDQRQTREHGTENTARPPAGDPFSQHSERKALPRRAV